MKKEVLKLKRMIAGVAILASLCFAFPTQADTLIVSRNGENESLTGEVLHEALDKSIVFETTDGQLHIFTAENIVEIKKELDDLPSMNHEELGRSLLADLPSGFKVLHTDNYVIAYKTELDYAKWIAKLYEKRLISEFEKFGKSKLRYPLTDSKFPLAIVVFGSRPEYDRYAARELGVTPGTMIAHYSQLTNRVAMYDLTFDIGGGPDRKLDDVLRTPAAIPMVTTIIHEATHQLMFNRGMQVRLADAPLWLNEGIANWFETPNLRNKKGWTRPGLVNNLRLRQFGKYLERRPANSIETLIANDDRFSFDGDRAFDAYAESWALIHFLLKRKKTEFREYLKAVSEKRPGFEVDEATRVKEFTDHFGDLEKLDKAFLKYVRTL